MARVDGHVHPLEVKIIHDISGYLGISNKDFESIQAMFYKDTTSAYKILEIGTEASDVEVVQQILTVKGRLELVFVTLTEENPVWTIRRWQDFRDHASAKLSWTELRAIFSQ